MLLRYFGDPAKKPLVRTRFATAWHGEIFSGKNATVEQSIWSWRGYWARTSTMMPSSLRTIKDAEQATEPWPAGYGDLWSCGDVVSLDGTKELGFSADQRAIMYDMAKRNERGKYLKVEGTWSFDETTKLYTVTLNGESVVYSIAEPAGGNCMLVNGDLSAANLRESWFPKPLIGPND
jgi:hypothetical protein